MVRAGHEVTVGAGRAWSLAGASRGARGVALRSKALTAPEAYVREVAALAASTGARVLIPITDASVDAVLGYRELLPPGLTLPLASLATYRDASDKVLVHQLASELGIGIVESVIVARPGREAPADARLYPGVVKPHRSVVGEGARIKTGVHLVSSHDECQRVLAALPEDAFPVLVQRRVHGPGEGIFLARWGGRTIARFAHRRLRENPPSGGGSVYRESIEADTAVLAACEALLDRLHWEGVAMIEGKRDSERGGWCVMEINGRFWGSLQLAIDAGVDFPALLVEAALGGEPVAPPAWRTGVRLRWEWGEIDHVLIRLTRSRERLKLPHGAPTKPAAVAAFLRHRLGRDRLEVLRLFDPLPFIVETLGRLRPG